MFQGFDMGQFQEMMQQLSKGAADFEAKLSEQKFVGTAGAGMVKIEINGAMQATDVQIDPEALEDKAALEVLICAAFNDAHRQAKEQLSTHGMADLFKGMQ